MDNRLKTFFFLAVLTALALWIGNFFGTQGMIFAAVFVVGMNVVMYFYSDKIALRMYKAQEADASKHSNIISLVREVAQQAKVPMPKVYILPTQTPNAFATGRNPKNGSVAVTAGIVEILTKSELKGVIAHEIAHIKNRDILITTISATVAGIISYVATMAQWAAIFGGFGGRDGDGGGIVQLLVLIIVAPIIALILRMAISRSREYMADKSGAEFIRDPYSLASALEKLEKGVEAKPLRHAPEGTEGLFIINPFKGQALVKLFSTHPPTEERVKRLRSMKL
jgi:heat shock protein HtpX